MKKKILLIATSFFLLTGFDTSMFSKKDKENWILISKDSNSSLYLDLNSIKSEAAGIYKYKEMYDAIVPFEVIKNDSRKAKSIVEENLVNCNDGKTKNGKFTAYSSNNRSGNSFQGESSLKIWIGSIPETPKRKLILAICDSTVKNSNSK